MITALEARQSELGTLEPGEPETGLGVVVADALTFLRNNGARMCYPAYRKAGLPITSSHMESTVKLFNRRVKGKEKLWSEVGAEAILQLRADFLSETDPLEKFWEDRQASVPGEETIGGQDDGESLQSQSCTPLGRRPGPARETRRTSSRSDPAQPESHRIESSRFPV